MKCSQGQGPAQGGWPWGLLDRQQVSGEVEEWGVGAFSVISLCPQASSRLGYQNPLPAPNCRHFLLPRVFLATGTCEGIYLLMHACVRVHNWRGNSSGHFLVLLLLRAIGLWWLLSCKSGSFLQGGPPRPTWGLHSLSTCGLLRLVSSELGQSPQRTWSLGLFPQCVGEDLGHMGFDAGSATFH